MVVRGWINVDGTDRTRLASSQERVLNCGNSIGRSRPDH
jgi:hypothetical protein